ncbi:methyltransferase domain-containing protein [Falsiroseomonas sp. E2-1-a20]|uniref:class I SAM-dependent methyltransferase n=1 Tax=Falsiroseomonas sp. E2-1-a20 TaxID=3239300 RepID=UPI003F2A8580
MPERDSVVRNPGSATDGSALHGASGAAQDIQALQRQVQQLAMRNEDYARQLAQAAATVAEYREKLEATAAQLQAVRNSTSWRVTGPLRRLLASVRGTRSRAIAPAADTRHDKVNEVWSVSPEAKAEAAGWYWMAHPMVRERINILVSGRPTVDGYARLAELLRERGETIPIKRALSLGCGFGSLERDLASRGMIAAMDAYDLADGAIREARRLAEEAGCGWIRYHVADLETRDLGEASHDVVFAHSSVHHVERLDELFATVRRALRPGGLFHLNEYVGPNRFQWTDDQLRLINGYLDSLPDHLRQTPAGRKYPVVRPSIEHMLAMDPTEAVRSADIREVLGRHFTIIEERPYGGTLLHMGLAEIAQNFDVNNAEDVAHLRRFFDLEDEMMANGTIGSDFTILTALRD